MDFPLLSKLNEGQIKDIMESFIPLIGELSSQYPQLGESTKSISQKYAYLLYAADKVPSAQNDWLMAPILKEVNANFKELNANVIEKSVDRNVYIEFLIGCIIRAKNVKIPSISHELDIIFHRIKVTYKIYRKQKTTEDKLKIFIKKILEGCSDGDQYLYILNKLISSFDEKMLEYYSRGYKDKFSKSKKVLSPRFSILKEVTFFVSLSKLNKLEDFIKDKSEAVVDKLFKIHEPKLPKIVFQNLKTTLQTYHPRLAEKYLFQQ